jgi:succinate dehydrogenase / fumarate reductase, iron-sulfur subunit
MPVTLRCLRFDPDKDAPPHRQAYQLPAEPMDRVWEGLNASTWYPGGTLTSRRSWGHGVYGSHTMQINGRNRLACTGLIRDAALRSRSSRCEPGAGSKISSSTRSRSFGNTTT